MEAKHIWTRLRLLCLYFLALFTKLRGDSYAFTTYYIFLKTIILTSRSIRVSDNSTKKVDSLSKILSEAPILVKIRSLKKNTYSEIAFIYINTYSKKCILTYTGDRANSCAGTLVPS